MERPRHLLPLAAFSFLLFIIGAASLASRSHNVRPVDALGLSGSGFTMGVAFMLLVLTFMGRKRR